MNDRGDIRDSRGRFALGHKGGPGNPHGKEYAKAREMVMKAMTEEDMKQVIAILKGQAEAGNTYAAGLLLRYCIPPNLRR